MGLVTMTEMLAKAREGSYAVGQFNMTNLEFTQAIVEAANEEQSPLILGIGEIALRYMGMNYTMGLVKAAVNHSTIPIALHLDHGSNFNVVMQCIQAGFSSVMIDGSHHPLADNIAITKKTVEASHAVGVSVEGELGRIGGVEENLTVEESEAQLTDPDEAIGFIRETGVDALAMAVGTAHGLYKSEPNVRIDNIRKVAEATALPLVLHGGSGIPDNTVRNSIQAGICKINVSTEMMAAFSDQVRLLMETERDIIDPRKFLRPAREAMKEVVRTKIRLFGSSGKA